MKMYCFSYAGGSAMVYAKWKGLIDDSIEIVPVELPGRGTRFAEDLCDSMEDLIEDIFAKYEDRFRAEDYLLYGHSMGSWVVYYLMNKIVHHRVRLPRQLFLSGKEAPHIKKNKPIVHEADNEVLIQKMNALGGTPSEFFADEGLMSVFVPILRNDYKVIETCQYKQPDKPFDCGITIFNGFQDDLNEQDIYEWSQYTSQAFQVYQFEGGHFFINEYAKDMLNIIGQIVKGNYRHQLNECCESNKSKENDPMEVKETVRKFISRYVQQKQFDNSDNIFEKGYVNSLFFMQLVLFIEKQFQLTIQNEDLAVKNFESVDSITSFIEARSLKC